MANQGKRMVPEYLIKEIGEGGAEYTAGTGIDITEDVISVDTETVAVKSDLATVATTGDYDDLTNKPTIPDAQVQSDWNQTDNAEVDFIKNKPTIPDAVSGTNDGTNWTSLTIGSDTYGVGGGSAPSNMVTTNTDQTISAVKTFDSDTTILSQSSGSVTLLFRAYGSNSGSIEGSLSGLSIRSNSGNTDLYAGGSTSRVRLLENYGTNVYQTPLKTSGTYTLATTDDITSVSGTNDGTNWTSLTVGSDTYAIPSGGGSSYTFTNGLTESSGTVSWDLNDFIKKSGTSNSSLKITSSGTVSGSSNVLLGGINGFLNGQYNVAIGGAYSNSSSTENSVVIGYGSSLKRGQYHFAAGGGTAGGGTLGNEQQFSIAIGHGTIANHTDQLAIGAFNIAEADPTQANQRGDKLLIIGNGTDNNNRSNALTVDWDGTIVSKNLPAVDTTTDGTYVLKATVSSGVVTYAWVLEV